MTPEEQDPHATGGSEIANPAQARASSLGHDEIILRAAQAAAREIRLERRSRFAKLGWRVAGVAAVLALALGAYYAAVALDTFTR